MAAMKSLIIGFTVLGLAAVAGLWVFASYAERSNIKKDSLVARLVIPADIRNLDLPLLCGTPSYSKQFLECGGTCGVSYKIEFPTTAPRGDLERFLEIQPLLYELEVSQTQVFSDEDGIGCLKATIVLDIDEREAM